jgi:hypothetical protein
MLEQNPAWIAAKTDFINAFNTADTLACPEGHLCAAVP